MKIIVFFFISHSGLSICLISKAQNRMAAGIVGNYTTLSDNYITVFLKMNLTFDAT
jgi:hypothetical protein